MADEFNEQRGGNVSAREFDASLDELRRAVDRARGTDSAVALREYIEALFKEQQRATDIAERERDNAAIALRSEQQRAADTAERERAKAADALAASLAGSIREGDERLREHVHNQFGQIKAAMDSSELLNAARVEKVEAEIAGLESRGRMHYDALAVQMAEIVTAYNAADVQLRTSFQTLAGMVPAGDATVEQNGRERLAAMQREFSIVNDASEKAIAKSEAASDRRFDSVNAFREQLAAQAATFMPREVAEATTGELSKRLAALENRTSQSQGETQGRDHSGVVGRAGMANVISLFALLVGLIGAIVAIVVATH